MLYPISCKTVSLGYKSPTIYMHAVAFDPRILWPFSIFPIARLDHGASLTAFDKRKLQPFASAADGGYPELSPWRSKGDAIGCVEPNVGEPGEC